MAAKAATAAKGATAKKPATKPKATAARTSGISGRTLTPSPELASVVGSTAPLARTEAVSKVWAYIREHGLQNPENKREILADDKLRAVFGQDKATMFELSGMLSKHLH